MLVDTQRYIDETMRFSKVLSLTAVRTAEEFSRRFIDPSEALCRWLPDQGVLLDVGSGMGVPGVPILLRKPGLHGVLVERRKKRAEFLRHIVRMLHLDAEVHDCDVRELTGICADACVARAVTKPEDLLPMIAPHMAREGLAVLPVPEALHSMPFPGWTVVSDEALLLQGIRQRILCYRFEGVSRET
jgi:16S rRNA (guanine527-N7)-methyltransferase